MAFSLILVLVLGIARFSIRFAKELRAMLQNQISKYFDCELTTCLAPKRSRRLEMAQALRVFTNAARDAFNLDFAITVAALVTSWL